MTPCKLTPELADKLITDLATGVFVTQVALKNGVHPETIKTWVQRGVAENAEEPYLSFARRFIEVDAEVERLVITRIQRAAKPRKVRRNINQTKLIQTPDGPREEVSEIQEDHTEQGDWKALAWFAERRWPKRWGSRAPGGTAGAPLDGSLDPLAVIDAAAQREPNLDELLNDPPTELADALLRNKDAVLKLLGSGE